MPKGAGPVPGMALGPAVFQCHSSSVLRKIREPTVGLVVWWRGVQHGIQEGAEALVALPPFSQVVADTTERAIRTLVDRLPPQARGLEGDIGHLAALFTGVTGENRIRLRLEHVDNDACRLHHVDTVGLRMLCTYSGLGTEWLDDEGTSHWMTAMQVAIFKGSKFADAAPRILHRSPPVSKLRKEKRSRVLLCIDQPGSYAS